MNRFTSRFAPKIEGMLEFRIARGLKEKTHLTKLLLFDKFCAAYYPDSDELTREIAYGWLDSETQRGCKYLTHKAGTLRQFGLYLNSIGENAFVLTESFKTTRNGTAPYIFSDSELTDLFAEIDKLSIIASEPFLHVMAPVMFRLTYTCGLRPKEGRELLWENINFDTGEIRIVNTKYKKERLVVMGGDMLSMCRQYDNQRKIFVGDNPYFFPAKDGGALANEKIHVAFNRAWSAAACNLLNPMRNRVRVYDLRHRFASARLNLWLDEGHDLMVMLPYLRAYMGHDKIEETAYYIHILPENLTKSSAIDWNKFNDMFSEVGV